MHGPIKVKFTRVSPAFRNLNSSRVLKSNATYLQQVRYSCRSQWPHLLRRESTAARLLELRIRIPPGGMDVCLLLRCVLSRRRSCDRPITCLEKSYLGPPGMSSHEKTINKSLNLHGNSNNINCGHTVINYVKV